VATQVLSPTILRGVVLIVITALLISLQDLTFKLFSGNMSLWQIFALRGIIALPLLMMVARYQKQLRDVLLGACAPWALMRTLCMTLAFAIYYGALPFVSLATAGAGIYLAPIFVALISVFFVKEPLHPLGWLGVCLGFLGVVVLLQPGSDAFTVFAALPLASAVFYALAIVITRTRCQGVPAEALALSFNASLMLAGFVVSLVFAVWPPTGALAENYPFLFGLWSNIQAVDWAALIGLAVFAALIGVLLAKAYQIAPPTTIATFEYSYIVFVVIWDVLFFGVALTGASLLGIAMIIGAGLLVMQRRSASS